jgi:transcriptional regulator with XRE-family HTH domain
MNLDDRRFLQDLGERLRRHRLDRKWTQAELGRRCALHRTFIGSVERGERNVSILNLRLIAKVLRVSLPDLLIDQA